MKAISAILAAILAAGGGAVSESSRPSTEIAPGQSVRLELGSEVITRLQAEYQEGQYDEFLQEMEKAYQQAKANNELEGLIELRKESVHYSFPAEKLIAGFDTIQKERNQHLLRLVADQPDSILVKKVRSAATPLSADIAEAIATLHSFHSKAPGTGQNSDENQIIEIDLATQYKQIHLDSLAAAGNYIPDRKEKHLILEMDKMDRMSEAAKTFRDTKLKKAVEICARANGERLTQHYDRNDLNALASGRIQPETDLESKVASIVAEAQAKFSALNRQLLDDHRVADQGQ